MSTDHIIDATLKLHLSYGIYGLNMGLFFELASTNWGKLGSR